MPRVTLKTVAERVGVSPMTVSNAYSRPDQLSAALREKILAVAAELGYAGPDPAARALARGGATGTVGILLSDSVRTALSDDFSVAFLTAVTEELARGGLALTLLPPDGDGPAVPTRDVAMDGAIVYSCTLGNDGLGWLRKRNLPLVHVDQPPNDADTSVNVEDRGGARLAAQHLVDLGHRRIGIVTVGNDGPEEREGSALERWRGWHDALDPAGITAVVASGPTSVEADGALAMSSLLAAAVRPTAVLCFSDVMAAGAIRVAREAGLQVPRDLSVVGFDDSSVALRTRPPLTTVRQDPEEKARTAAAALVDAVAHRQAGTEPEIRHVVLPTRLVVRESTAAPPPGDDAQ